MKIVKVERRGQTAEGIVEGDAVKIIGAWLDGVAESAAFSLSRQPLATLESLASGATETVALDEVTLAVPIDPLARIMCVGMNYRDHVSEIKLEVAPNPTIFTRTLDSLVAPGQSIIRPRVSEKFDFEGEIAVIIGREGRHVRREDAMDHVGGYSCFLDGSVRDYQKHSLTAGKNFWRTGSMGPWIVTADEFGVADALLETRLNGTTVQSAHASQMIFDIPAIIEYLSRMMVLRPGDVIATGTPGGVGARRDPPLWMRAGDRTEVEVEGIGTLRNAVVDER